MEAWSIGLLGIIIGMQHALEADHLAAIATLFADKSSRLKLVKRGAAWGVGHTLSLVSMCSIVLLMGVDLTSKNEAFLELFVGIVVVMLGLNLFRTMKRKRIHVHSHQHHQGKQHLHVHSHEFGNDHKHAINQDNIKSLGHTRKSEKTGLLKPLIIGIIHGLAGSGALLLVLAATTNSFQAAISYVLFFGFGSICGMAALSFAISFPLKKLGKMPDRFFKVAMISVSSVAVFVGSNLVITSWAKIVVS